MEGGSDKQETASAPSRPLSSESGSNDEATPAVHSELPAAKRSSNRRRSSGSSSSPAPFRIRHALPLVFAGLFVLNSLNGEKIMRDISGQLHETYNYYIPTQPTPTQLSHANRTEDTAIIITSSYIPSHPSTYMIETVLNSTKQLIGLSETAPIGESFRYIALVI